jgi:hypothetical protein
MTTRNPPPYDPFCKRYATDMPELDRLWSDGPEHLATYDEEHRKIERAEYARADGTYDPRTGHFACDTCYIQFGTSRRVLMRKSAAKR